MSENQNNDRTKLSVFSMVLALVVIAVVAIAVRAMVHREPPPTVRTLMLELNVPAKVSVDDGLREAVQESFQNEFSAQYGIDLTDDEAAYFSNLLKESKAEFETEPFLRDTIRQECVRRSLSEETMIRQLMGKALRLSADGAERESVIREEIGRMLLELLRDEVRGSDRDRTPFELLRARMRLHPEQRWNVAEMAARCGVSLPHFFVLCRRHYGMSPYQMLKQLRMEQACELLTSTAYPVKVVASLCGYDHLFSFSRCFRSIFQMPPTRYRREHRAGGNAEDAGTRGLQTPP